jgi:ABC-type glycerol-3-phosphate transport system substrate-binding protein
LDSLYEQLDALTGPELGCVLRFTYIAWGEERKQLNIAIASGEYDLIPAGNFSDYHLMITRNAFADMKPYLPWVPALQTHFLLSEKDVLGLMEIDGKLYGIPQYSAPGVGAGEGFFYREDLRKQWRLPPIHDIQSMEAYLYRAKREEAYAGKPLITDNRIWTCLWRMIARDTYQEIIGFTETPYAVIAIDHPERVVSRIETPAFMEVLNYLVKWYRDGILDGQLIASAGNEGEKGLELFKTNEKPCETNTPIWSLNRSWVPMLTALHPEWEYAFFPYDLNGKVSDYKRSAVSSTVITLSSRAQYPEIAMKLLEKLHTDQRYYDLLVYGVLGEHYFLDDEGIHFSGIPADKRYAGWTGAADTYMDYPNNRGGNAGWASDVYGPVMRAYEAKSKQAVFHPLDDLVLDVKPMTAEIENLSESWRRYIMPLLCGLENDGTEADLIKAVERLNEAGLTAYLAELQRQVDRLNVP